MGNVRENYQPGFGCPQGRQALYFNAAPQALRVLASPKNPLKSGAQGDYPQATSLEALRLRITRQRWVRGQGRSGDSRYMDTTAALMGGAPCEEGPGISLALRGL